MNIKQILIAATPLITFGLGLAGYEPIKQAVSPAPVDVDIELTTQEHVQHTHPSHKHEDVRKIVREELEKARAEHTRIHH